MDLKAIWEMSVKPLAIATLAVFALVPPAAAETLMERGTYLVHGIVACGNCHTTKMPEGREAPGMELAGGFLAEEKGVFKAFAPNITPDPGKRSFRPWNGSRQAHLPR